MLLGSVPSESTYVLDLRSGRTLLRDYSTRFQAPSAEDPDEDYWSYFEPPTLSDPLAAEAIPDFSYVSPPLWKVGDRTVSLGTSGSDLYAATQELAPRFLLLARDAAFIQLSRDGRTLFFERGGALWRADLRKPVPELLDELRSPELPDAPLGGE
jgi:hypothetical protein